MGEEMENDALAYHDDLTSKGLAEVQARVRAKGHGSYKPTSGKRQNARTTVEMAHDPRVPKRIWLLPKSGIDGETTWCDCPNPGGIDDNDVDAVEFVQVKTLRPTPTEAGGTGEGEP